MPIFPAGTTLDFAIAIEAKVQMEIQIVKNGP